MFKKATTPQEQIELLREKNVFIEDEEYAIKILGRISYYRLAGYLLPFKSEQNDTYENISFKKLVLILRFDQLLRSWILEYMEHVEISIRTFIINVLAFEDNRSGLAYLNSEYFVNKQKHEEFLSDYKKDGPASPIWAVIELPSFGVVSRFFANLKPQYKKHIASFYISSIEGKALVTSLLALCHLRNKCAHYNRIYFRAFAQYPLKKVWYQKHGLDYSHKRLYPLLHVMRDLCVDQNIWNSHLENLKSIVSQYEDFIDLEHLNFPIDWYDKLWL